jgi:hypothetical protein
MAKLHQIILSHYFLLCVRVWSLFNSNIHSLLIRPEENCCLSQFSARLTFHSRHFSVLSVSWWTKYIGDAAAAAAADDHTQTSANAQNARDSRRYVAEGARTSDGKAGTLSLWRWANIALKNLFSICPFRAYLINVCNLLHLPNAQY